MSSQPSMGRSLDTLAAAVSRAHANASLLVQLSPYWARIAAARARSCDLVSQLGSLCGVFLPLDCTLTSGDKEDHLSLVISSSAAVSEASPAYEALDVVIPTLVRAIRSAFSVTTQWEAELSALIARYDLCCKCVFVHVWVGFFDALLAALAFVISLCVIASSLMLAIRIRYFRE